MKSAFLDKIVERIDRIDPKNLQGHFLHLAQEKGLMEAIFQALHEGVVVLDANGKVSYINKSAERMLGIQSDTALGRPASRYLKGIDWDRVLDLDAGEWSKMINYELELNYPERRFLSLYVAPLSTEEDSPKGLLIMLRDITKDREAEASALESERLNAVRLLAAGVAHEIGNPLNALNIHLQLIGRQIEQLPPNNRDSIRESLDIAREEVARLDMTITQFLKALRPGFPDLALSSIEEILKSTLKLLEHDIRNRNIRVGISSPSAVPRIPVDPHQISQAFFNVIKNSLQAMPDGGSIRIELSCTDRFFKVAFHDTGIGIAKSALGRIFEPYYTTKPDGTGLGMMIVQRIVQDHGGAIEVHSEQGAGTTVTILLPVVEREMRLLKSKSTDPEVPDK